MLSPGIDLFLDCLGNCVKEVGEAGTVRRDKSASCPFGVVACFSTEFELCGSKSKYILSPGML